MSITKNNAEADAGDPTITASTPTETGVAQLTELLRDDRFDRSVRLLRLQGWRGAELTCAIGAGQAHRLAPGFCAVGAAAIAVTGSAWLAAALMGTAVVGLFARNHPVETLYNAVASRTGRSTIPRNKAAKRLGCALGTLFLGASSVSIALGAEVLGRSLAGAFAAVAGFVAVTNVCVPSMVFTTLWGTERAKADKLI
jgi:hypothetical protein